MRSITKLYVEELSLIVTSREGALAGIQREFFTAEKDREPVADLMCTRRAAVEAATAAL